MVLRQQSLAREGSRAWVSFRDEDCRAHRNPRAEGRLKLTITGNTHFNSNFSGSPAFPLSRRAYGATGVWAEQDFNPAAADIAGITSKRSPAVTCPPRVRSAAISITQKAVNPSAIRPGSIPRRTLITRPLRATKTTSIANRMKKVCTELLGAITRAVSPGSPSRPRSPRRRLFESSAGSRFAATSAPVVAFLSENADAGWRTTGARKPGRMVQSDRTAASHELRHHPHNQHAWSVYPSPLGSK